MGPPKGEIVSGSSHLIGEEHHVESAPNLFICTGIYPWNRDIHTKDALETGAGSIGWETKCRG